jgi:hypothetical protein
MYDYDCNQYGRSWNRYYFGRKYCFKVKKTIWSSFKRNQVLKKRDLRSVYKRRSTKTRTRNWGFVSNTYKEYEDQKSLTRLEEEIKSSVFFETSLETLRVFINLLNGRKKKSKEFVLLFRTSWNKKNW